MEGQNVVQDGFFVLVYILKYVFMLWMQYQVISDLFVGGGVCYVGSLCWGSDGVVGILDYIEGYWVVDVKLGYWVNRNFDLQFNMYNLFDIDYVVFINKSGYCYYLGEFWIFMLMVNVYF